MSEKETMIRLEGIKKRFRTKAGELEVLHGVSADIKKGEVFGIIGLSGAGKSTLVRCINLLERPTAGKVWLDGVELTALDDKELREQRRHMGMIFQQFHLLMQRTALDNVCFPMEISGVPKAKAKERAKELLELVGLADRMESYPAQLSGGQKQRVAIARALATEPKVLLCDEATSALDPNTTAGVLSLLKDINTRLGITIVVITHEMSVIQEICDRVAIIDGGLIAEEGGVEEAKADEILTFIAIRGTNGEVLSALEQYRSRNEVFDQGLDELSSVTKLLGAFGVPEENFAVDLTIARGLDYYTGTVYETTLLDHPEIGSVCSGGRYDNLAEYYTDRPLPGVGISIGLTRLFYVLNEQRMLNEERVMAPADVMIVPMTDDLEAAVRLATELRAQNIRVQLYAEQKKFKAKIQYADKLHIPYVVFLGEDEIAAGTVSLKDLRTGDQVTVPAQDAAAHILADIELRGQGTILK